MPADRSRPTPPAVRAGALACAVFLAASPLAARSPADRDTILDGGDEAVLKPPIVVFARALRRIEMPRKPAFKAAVGRGSPAERTVRADLADLAAALNRADLPADRRTDALAAYTAARRRLAEYAEAIGTWGARAQRPGGDAAAPRPSPPALDLPADIPSEFGHYLRGALDWHKGESAAAVVTWHGLLKLPKADRHYRSTWAAYMIGKALLDSDAKQAGKWLARVRELAEAGFADRLHLAADSYGWQALAELKQNHFVRAAELYLAQLALGDSTAVVSLRTVAHRAFRAGGETLQAAAKSDAARAVLTAYLVSYKQFIDDPWVGASRAKLTGTWLKAVRDAGAEAREAPSKLAWLTYQAGELDAAADWARKAAPASPLAKWVEAKLLLRKKKTDAAAARLADALRAAPDRDEWRDVRSRISGEMAALRMARRQYVEALDLLLRADLAQDAAYVAERVLTAEELKAYVDRRWPRPAKPGDDEDESPAARKARRAIDVRYLLGRRLVRLGRLADAQAYLPKGSRATLALYRKTLAEGSDAARPKPDRARALLRAGRILEAHGRLLMATGLEWYRSRYGRDRAAGRRLRPPKGEPILRVSDDERKRVFRHRKELGRKLEHRYVAAEHGWAAAKLMPDELTETARALCEAGSWIKGIDPKAADPFYKAMVLRCGTTELGKQAARRRWFPPLPAE